jgi:hypothetical protein
MKITREQLKQLVSEVIRKEQGILLEAEPMSGGYSHPGDVHTRGDMGADPGREETADVLKTLQDLYHLGEKATQLHDMLCNENRLEPDVIESITLASDAIGKLFDSILYEKTKGNVQ